MISMVSNQNGKARLYIIVEIYHSGFSEDDHRIKDACCMHVVVFSKLER